jgi:lactoylglutathione lyase
VNVTVDRIFEAHLTVRNVALSTAFYRDRLGLEVAHVSPERVAFLWAGGRGRTMLGLWAAGAAPQHVTGHVAFATTVANVVAAPALLERSGITPLDFDGRPTAEAVVLAWMPAAAVYFRDPDDHLLEFVAMLDDEPRPERGVVTWSDWRSHNGCDG